VLKIIITLLAGSCLIVSSGCGKKKPSSSVNTPAPSEVKKVIQKTEFVPPADSLITAVQIKSWIACNPILDSLAIMYTDSFKTTDPQKRLRYQDDFSAAQDKICVITGLNGGYTEYKWIMDNIGNPKNRSVVENANASVY